MCVCVCIYVSEPPCVRVGARLGRTGPSNIEQPMNRENGSVTERETKFEDGFYGGKTER